MSTTSGPRESTYPQILLQPDVSQSSTGTLTNPLLSVSLSHNSILSLHFALRCLSVEFLFVYFSCECVFLGACWADADFLSVGVWQPWRGGIRGHECHSHLTPVSILWHTPSSDNVTRWRRPQMMRVARLTPTNTCETDTLSVFRDQNRK